MAPASQNSDASIPFQNSRAIRADLRSAGEHNDEDTGAIRPHRPRGTVSDLNVVHVGRDLR